MELTRSTLVHLMSEAERYSAVVKKAREKLDDLRATAESEDGLVSATVGARGELHSLTLDPRVFRKPDAGELAESIVATVATAMRSARKDALAASADLMPHDADPEHFDFDADPVLHQLDRLASGHVLDEVAGRTERQER
ncbi:MAG: YbaB/EbfC family nucleoid-associated protein [Thermocrispum sp.]